MWSWTRFPPYETARVGVNAEQTNKRAENGTNASESANADGSGTDASELVASESTNAEREVQDAEATHGLHEFIAAATGAEATSPSAETPDFHEYGAIDDDAEAVGDGEVDEECCGHSSIHSVRAHDFKTVDVSEALPFPSHLLEESRFPSLDPGDTSARLAAILNDKEDSVGIAMEAVEGAVGQNYKSNEWEAFLTERFDFLEARLDQPERFPLATPPKNVSPVKEEALSTKRKAEELDGVTPEDSMTSSSPVLPKTHGRVATIKLPAPRGGTTRQSKQQSSAGQRTAAIVVRVNCPVSLVDYTGVLNYLRLLDVAGAQASYPQLYTDILFTNRAPRVTIESRETEHININFSIPFELAANLRAAIVFTKATALGLHTENYVASVSGMDQGLTEIELEALKRFEAVSLGLARYKKDTNWLSDEKLWGKTLGVQQIPFLNDVGGGVNEQSEADPLGVNAMRRAAIETLSSYSLMTLLSTTSTRDQKTAPPGSSHKTPRPQTVMVAQVLGRLQRSVWLNDAVVNFALHAFAATLLDVTVVDSLCVGRFDVPRALLKATRLVVFPINFSNTHWCLIIVHLDWKKGQHSAFGYDPLHSEGWGKDLTHLWASWCSLLVAAWFDRDRGLQEKTETQAIGELGPVSWQLLSTGTPKQNDGHSCGVYCINQALSYMTEYFSMQEKTSFTAPELQVLRLRILHLILVKSTAHVNSKEKAKYASILKKFNDHTTTHAPQQAMTTRTKKRASTEAMTTRTKKRVSPEAKKRVSPEAKATPKKRK